MDWDEGFITEKAWTTVEIQDGGVHVLFVRYELQYLIEIPLFLPLLLSNFVTLEVITS